MKHWLNLHLILSIFFLPLILAYAITGGMYMAGAPAQLGSNIQTIELNTGAEPPDAEWTRYVLREISGFAAPEGDWRKGKNGKYILGSSAGKHVQASVDKARGVTTFELIEPGLYPQMLLIHKGKAGLWFTILGYGAAASMLLLYVSGVCIVAKNKAKRPMMLAALALGIAAVVAGLLAL